MSDVLARAARIVGRAGVLALEGRHDLARELRRTLTRDDPALFALVYLGHHMRNADGVVTLSEVHTAWAESAKTWMLPTEPASDRRAEVAPREMGKSTWWFLLLPMWGAAHGHIRFAAAFADTDAQAQTHLATFKAELDSNARLRYDFPDLVEPKTRGRGTVMADRVSLYHARSGFVFAAAGMDSSNLGLKIGDRRPDLLILDDIEPHEGRYSRDLAAKRLGTLREVIFPLNIRAHVVMVGTVTMQGSIVHQIVKRARGDYVDGDGTEWVDEEHVTARHWLPIVTDDDGERRSIWPAKWSLAYLASIEHTRGYAKNYANDPLGADGDYWQMNDFVTLTPTLDAGVTYEVISVDPAVTSKESSDFTAIAAVGYDRTAKRCAVYECRAVKLPPDGVRLQVLAMVERALARGHHVIVIVETNQGGDLWPRMLHSMVVKVKPIHVSEPKPVRAADALDHYQRGRVEHAPGLRDAEGQMVAFPNAPNDDMVDAIGAGVRYFLSRGKAKRITVGGTSVPYT